MNLQLHKVLSDVTGVTGMNIIRAIIAGERDPQKLALMREAGVKSTPEATAKALEGDYRQEHLFVLKQAVELYDFYHQQIEACDREIERYLRTFESKVDLVQNPLPKQKRRKEMRHQSFTDLRTELYRMSGIDFTQIPGLDVVSVQTILSEVGLDPGKFPPEKRFVSWLGLCPNNRITGGQVKSSKTRKTVNRAANAFRMAAQALASSNTGPGDSTAVSALAWVLRRRSLLPPTSLPAYSTGCGPRGSPMLTWAATTIKAATRSGCSATLPRGRGSWAMTQSCNRSSSGLLRRCSADSRRGRSCKESHDK